MLLHRLPRCFLPLARSAFRRRTSLTPAGADIYVNVDEGWFVGRDPKTKAMVEDKKAFPSGMAGLGKWVHNLEVRGKGKIMKYGLYTSRGVQQCDTGEYIKRCAASGLLHPPGRCEGTHGFEKEDAAWLVGAGADYLKEDSCGGVTHGSVWQQYAKMRDALNATGRPIYYSITQGVIYNDGPKRLKMHCCKCSRSLCVFFRSKKAAAQTASLPSQPSPGSRRARTSPAWPTATSWSTATTR